MLKSIITILFTLLLILSCNGTSPKSDKDKNISTPTSNLTSLQQEALDAHNKARAKDFKGAEVTWNTSIATTAQSYADELAKTGKFEHDNSNYGENIFAASEDKGYQSAVDSWYDEKADYNYNNNSCNSVCGHYTQVVWKKTTEIGCGKATYTYGNMKGSTVIVCRYNPRGNFGDEKPY